MNRYYKLQNGDIFDNKTRTTISREKLLEILIFDKMDEKMVSDETTYKKAMEKYNELARDENSVLD